MQHAAQVVDAQADVRLQAVGEGAGYDAILVLDNVFVPWEDVFMHGDVDQANDFAPKSGFNARAAMHGCTRLAVKLDFITGLMVKALEITGTHSFHGVMSRMGEVIAWRNTMWGLSDAMAKSNIPWNGMVQPDARFGAAYRTISLVAFPLIKQIIEASVTSIQCFCSPYCWR